MQGKGFIKFFTAVLILVGLFQLLLYIPTNNEEKRAERYAKKIGGDDITARDRAYQFYLDSISDKSLVPVFGFTYPRLKQQQLALGLDLKGGMSVVLQVDLYDLVVALANNSQDPEFRKALAEARKRQTNSQADFVTLFGQTYKELTGGKKLATIFYTNPSLKEKINFNSSDADVIATIREEAKGTVKRTYELLKQRIDKFGVTQPNVFLDEASDRINVELPGVRNPERARNFLQASAKLEFWELYDAQEILPGFLELDKALKAGSTVAGDTSKTVANSDSTAGPLFKIFSPSGYKQTLGQAIGSDTARINRFLESESSGSLRSVHFAWDAKPNLDKTGKKFFSLYALRPETGNKASLEGDVISDAGFRPSLDGRAYEVDIAMKTAGANKWRDITRRNKDRQVAVVLDNKIYSAPNVISEISGGNTQITGNFSAQEAEDLSSILKIGKLPARTEIIESVEVGPSLGQAAVSSGLISMLAAIIVVMMFMMGYYGLAGGASIIALALNMFFIAGTLASFGTVLTLPGIAGIVLTMAVAVDANVVVYERVREELRHGAEYLTAIKRGFLGSYPALIDANITTLITAVVLFFFGLGPIKGFATTLIIGTITSFFTAVFIAHLIIDYWNEKGSPVSFWLSEKSKNILTNTNYDFIGIRKYTYAFSAILVIISILAIFGRGFQLGVDFQGGRAYTVFFDQNVNTEALSQSLTKAFDGEKPWVRTIGSPKQVKITTSYLHGKEGEVADADAVVLKKLYEACKEYGKFDASLEDFARPGTKSLYLQASNKVGATVADDIRNSASWATILSMIGIFIYILIRFRKWQYSLGAVVALAHDTIILLGIFALLHGVVGFSLEIDQAFIAAVLTVIGYSMNDTVIVFDRLREYLNHYERKPMAGVVNDAINSTLSRTIITSSVTFFVMAVLFFFGGDAIKGFSFAIMLGVVKGTYSSIFVATPLMYDFSKAEREERERLSQLPIEEVIAEESTMAKV